jgi:hypothetical protein
MFGLIPALHAGRTDVTTALKSEARGSTGSSEHTRARRLLVVAEFALALVLMVAAGLLLRSFWDLLHAPLGFSPQQVLTVRTRLPYPNDVSIDKYGTIAHEAPFLREVIRRSPRLPGVEEVALGSSSAIPLDHPQQDTNLTPLLIEGRGTDAAQAPLVEESVVTPEYFHLLGRTLLRGRLLTNFDNETAPGVAVINDAIADVLAEHQPARPARQALPIREVLDNGRRHRCECADRIAEGRQRAGDLRQRVSGACETSRDLPARTGGCRDDSRPGTRASAAHRRHAPGLRRPDAQ